MMLGLCRWAKVIRLKDVLVIGFDGGVGQFGFGGVRLYGFWWCFMALS